MTCHNVLIILVGENILPLFEVNGVFINLALPTFDLPSIPIFQFTTSQIAIASSFVGKSFSRKV
jgi:hypothetical protein